MSASRADVAAEYGLRPERTRRAVDPEIEQLRNWGQNKVLPKRHPNFFKQSCLAYQRIAVDGNVGNVGVRLYTFLTERALINFPGSDQSGGIEISIRKLCKLIPGGNAKSLKRGREELVKNQYILVKKIGQKSGRPKFKYFIRAIVPDQTLVELEGLSPVGETAHWSVSENGHYPMGESANGSVGSSANGSVGSSANGSVGSSAHTYKEGVRMEGKGAGGASPPGGRPDMDRIPEFNPIQPGTFDSTLRTMLQECHKAVRDVHSRHTVERKVFLRQAEVEWLEEAAKPMGRTDTGKALKKQYLDRAEALKADPTNWKVEKVLTPLGEQIKAAWNARAREINRILTGAR